MKRALSTIALSAALITGPAFAAVIPPTEDLALANTHESGVELPGVAEPLVSIEAGSSAPQRFHLQVEFALSEDDHEIEYVDRTPSRVMIDESCGMLRYPDQRGHERVWSLIVVHMVDVQTGIAFHEDSDARNGETRRGMSVLPASFTLVVPMNPGKVLPMHVWGVADGAVSHGIAHAMRRASTPGGAGGGCRVKSAPPAPDVAVRQS